MASQPRGLHNFIADIRNAPNLDEERIRIDKELANIRAKFVSSSNLNSYQKKKYVWKICYIYMLGYEIDFGIMEVISLLSSTNFSEKSVGYMGVSLLIKPGDEMMTLVVNSMRNDLIGNIHHGVTLSLAAIANIGGNDLAEALGPDVQRLITHPNDAPKYANPNTVLTMEDIRAQKAVIRKKAVLCLLRLFRTNPDSIDVADWAEKLPMLLEDGDIGVVLSSMSLLLGFGSSAPEHYEPLVPFVVQILTRLIINKKLGQDYLYYQIPSPWLLVKCFRFLQYFRAPVDPRVSEQLNEILRKVLSKNAEYVADAVNKCNAEHAILFEAASLVVAYAGDAEPRLHEQVLSLLGKFISTKEANIRYLGLDAMSRLARLDGPAACQRHQSVVVMSLKDADVSVGKRSLDLLYLMTDHNNAEEVVSELLINIAIADPIIKDDYVVKIAILAEKFAPNKQWYLDTMVQTIMVAGDHVSDDVWHRIVRIITNNTELHEYAAEKLMGIVQSKYAHETAVALGSYVLGEFGMNICEKTGMTGYEQYAAIHQHFPTVSVKTRGLMLTAYVKIMNLYPDCVEVITEVFRKHATSGHLDLQQRSCEYLRLPKMGVELMEKVLNSMPLYPENKENALLSKLEKAEDSTVDKSVWKTERPDRQPTQYYEEEAPPVKSSFQQQPVSVTKQVDLLSLDDDDMVGPASSAPVGLQADVVPLMRRWFNSAVLGQSGVPVVLFENNVIKVVVMQEYRVYQGRVSVEFHNKGDEINDFIATIGTVDYLQIQRQEPSSRISISDSTRLGLAVSCSKPFADVLEMSLSFRVGAVKYLYPLRLPINALSFFEPIVLDKAMYMQRWKLLEGEDKEVQEIFSCGNKISAALVNAFRANVIPALHLGLATGLDNDLSVTACGSFRTGTPAADGNGMITIGAMMRLEADEANNRFRITVRAKHGLISQAIRNIVKAQLS